MLRACVFALAFVLSDLSIATEPRVALWCARGKADYPDAAMTLHARGSHAVHVVYVGYRPSRARADWTLRDCLQTASRLDGSRDIIAWLWYRERDQGQPHELLKPYSLVYKAASKTVVAEQ